MEGSLSCHICDYKIETSEWMTIGAVQDQVTADFAKETLKSQGVPSVVNSLSGFFGSVGLPLYPFFDSKTPLIEIAVPSQLYSEAVEVLDMVLGDRWQKKELK